MFQYIEKVLSKGVFQFQIKQDGVFLTVSQVIKLWQTDAEFRFFYNQILKEAPLVGFFWENKPINNQRLNELYEFVLVETTAFSAKIADKSSFLTYFEENKLIVCFPNLGRNAELIVPCPLNNEEDTYMNIATFIRNAPAAQLDAFWMMVGTTLEKRLSTKPIWLSTSGLGVYWLHVRLDEFPKYYSYAPYKSF